MTIVQRQLEHTLEDQNRPFLFSHLPFFFKRNASSSCVRGPQNFFSQMILKDMCRIVFFRLSKEISLAFLLRLLAKSDKYCFNICPALCWTLDLSASAISYLSNSFQTTEVSGLMAVQYFSTLLCQMGQHGVDRPVWRKSYGTKIGNVCEVRACPLRLPSSSKRNIHLQTGQWECFEPLFVTRETLLQHLLHGKG